MEQFRTPRILQAAGDFAEFEFVSKITSELRQIESGAFQTQEPAIIPLLFREKKHDRDFAAITPPSLLGKTARFRSREVETII